MDFVPLKVLLSPWKILFLPCDCPSTTNSILAFPRVAEITIVTPLAFGTTAGVVGAVEGLDETDGVAEGDADWLAVAVGVISIFFGITVVFELLITICTIPASARAETEMTAKVFIEIPLRSTGIAATLFSTSKS